MLVILGACGRQPKATAAGATAQAPAGILVDTTTVRAPLQLPAQLYVEHDAVVVARAAGNVDSVLADLNDHVSVGAPLALLESADQQIALAQAEASFDNLSKSVVRARLMTKAGGITVADSENVELQYRQADLARRKARRDIELTRVAAPFSGVVTARYARAGRFVNVGDTLFRVTETAPLMARVRVPEATAASVHVGDHATVANEDGARRRGERRSGDRRGQWDARSRASCRGDLAAHSRRERHRSTRRSTTARHRHPARCGHTRRIRARRRRHRGGHRASSGDTRRRPR
jgi:RND family efflux transporter MFP subunit